MEAERYKKIDELFDAALDLESAAREDYLTQECGGDLELRREVESLLNAFDEAGNFIVAPAMEAVAESLATDREASLIGKRIAFYEVISLIGAGGMGEVYLARDTRLGRNVALKILPPRFTQDAERLLRFQRESRAASALNHPNILTIYEIGEDHTTHFIASEYVEGDTLRQKINRGQVPLKEVVEIAVQTANALAAAHQAGIVHRDIKPENIKLRKDGYVKVLDFGLAKLTEVAAAPDSGGRSFATQSGAILGTINYMSPEQALGQVVDHRTDLFSLGVVLYEMITGNAPFKGATAAATFDAILNRQPPPIASLNPDVSPGLERTIKRLLEKDRDLRFQTAADLRAVLKGLQRGIESGVTASATGGMVAPANTLKKVVSHWWMKAALALSIVALLMATGWVFSRGGSRGGNDDDWLRATPEQITDHAGAEYFPSLSPDGKALIYTSRLSGNYDIYYKRIGTKKVSNLTEESRDDDTQPAFSPDGKRIAFRSSRQGGGIFIMSETGESVRPLTNFGFNPAWSPDGKEIVCTEFSADGSNRTQLNSRMWVINTTTGESRLILERDAVQTNWSPSGKRIAYWGVHNGTQRDIWTIPAGGGEPVAVTNDTALDFNPVWSPSGDYLYFISNRNGIYALWRVAIDEASGKVTANPEPVPLPSQRTEQFCLSRDGKRLAFMQINRSQNAYRLAFDPVAETVLGEPTPVTHGSTTIGSPVISPDGKLLAYSATTTMSDIFVLKIGSTLPSQITQDAGRHLVPRWSPDGKRIAVYSNQTGVYQIYSFNSDGSDRRQLTYVAAPGAVYGIFSPVNSRLAYSLFGGKTYIIDLQKPFDSQTPHETPFFPGSTDHFIAWDWSPDGRFLAGSSNNDDARPGVHIYSPDSRQYEQISEIGERCVWLSDNNRLISTTGSGIYLIDRRTKKTKELYSFYPNRIGAPSITNDNRAIYFALAVTEADIWLMTLDGQRSSEQ